MTKSIELQQEIRRILEESEKPLGPTAIAEILKSRKNTVSYHLKKLESDGIIISPENGKYSINKDELEIINELGIKALNILSSKECSPKELEHELCSSDHEIFGALLRLELDALIKEGQISLDRRGGIPRKGLTTNVSNHYRTSTYVPTYLGYSKIGLCPICKDKINDYETVVVSFFRTSYIFRPHHWASVKIHSKCSSNSKPHELIYGKKYSSVFCNHCGLPLSPKVLQNHHITHKSVSDHFFGFELESIRLLDKLEQSWIVPFENPISDILDEKFATTPQNSTIEEVYNELKIEIPEWLSEILEEDRKDTENNPEKSSYEDISWSISKDIDYRFKTDLSVLNNAENFVNTLVKYRTETPEDYDVKSRINQIWTASLEMKKIYENNVSKSYEKLLGPEGNLYSCIDWPFDAKDYDFDKVRSEYRFERNHPTTFTQTFAVKYGDNYFHPYCADKLGLNDDHGHDKKSKGGENSE